MNTAERYVEAMVTLFEIKDKVQRLRDEGNFGSMKKVIDDELLKASVGKNKVLKQLVEALDQEALSKAEFRIHQKYLDEADKLRKKEAKRLAYEASKK